ncbi:MULTISPECIES: helix-turn-helix domain-containing protein [Asaia]|uniref:helix-turn-helix domain-containing protein n=1 Tax=Asaia TaxID=91914 RepID=UPI000780F812|nr:MULTISPECIES: helix-turn-helix transcriptional regulator [Asaia]MDL2170618.1 helix-turn-helix transcriptional regulator [Asaia sp. HumB]GBQ76377.1 transcriptional regulator [Asaia bogorensis NBRC 16594]
MTSERSQKISPSFALTRRIAMLRKSQGLSQQQLADTLGVSRSAVAFWETGRVGSLRKYIPKLADLFGVSTEVFLTGMIEEDIPAVLTPDEDDLLRLYRLLNPEMKLTAQKWMERQVHKQNAAGKVIA